MKITRCLCYSLRLFPALTGLLFFHTFRAEYQTVRELAERMLQLAERLDDGLPRIWAHVAMGSTLTLIGEFRVAREHLERGIALSMAQQSEQTSLAPLGMGSHSLRLIGGEVQALKMTVFTLWHLGYTDQAVRGMQMAIALAQGQPHPFSLATALEAAAHFSIVLRQVEACRTQAEECLRLCAEYDFQNVRLQALLYRGWAVAQQGQVEEGLAQMQDAFAARQAAGVRILTPDYLTFLAEVYRSLGRSAEGLEAIGEALALGEETGERHSEAEMYRLKGELLLLNDEC